MSIVPSRPMRIVRAGCAAVALVFMYLAVAAAAAAQPAGVRERLRVVDSTRVQILTTADGSELVGRITAIQDSTLTFQVGDNHLSLRLTDIRSIEERPARAGGERRPWFAHANRTTLVLGPTGRTLGRGEGQFALYELFFPTLSYGFTDRLTLGGGITLIPGAGFDDQIVYLLPKVGVVRSESMNIAVGALVLRAGDPFDDGDESLDPFGILYGVGTFGGPDANLTTGLGFGFYGGDLASRPLMQLGGQIRIHERMALISENWFFRTDRETIMVSWTGMRFLARKVSFDAAVAFSPPEDGWIPWVSVTLAF